MNRHRILLSSLLVAVLSGCASLGSWEEILGDMAGGAYGNELTGEIRQVDTRRREIELTSGWGGSDVVRYDGRTEVIYRDRRYDVGDLERGDRVRVRVDGTNDRTPYASVIRVEESIGAGSGDVYERSERIEGRVAEVDARRGWFELADGRDSGVVVTLPYEPNRALRDRFQRLRRGDRVRFEGVRLNRSRIEILRFM